MKHKTNVKLIETIIAAIISSIAVIIAAIINYNAETDDWMLEKNHLIAELQDIKQENKELNDALCELNNIVEENNSLHAEIKKLAEDNDNLNEIINKLNDGAKKAVNSEMKRGTVIITNGAGNKKEFDVIIVNEKIYCPEEALWFIAEKSDDICLADIIFPFTNDRFQDKEFRIYFLINSVIMAILLLILIVVAIDEYIGFFSIIVSSVIGAFGGIWGTFAICAFLYDNGQLHWSFTLEFIFCIIFLKIIYKIMDFWEFLF